MTFTNVSPIGKVATRLGGEISLRVARLAAPCIPSAARAPVPRVCRSLAPLSSSLSDLGPVRKLSNRLLIELHMGLQPSLNTIYCGGDRYRTDQRAIFRGGPFSR